MMVLLGLWALMAVTAVFFGLRLTLPAALGTWVAFSAIICTVGAVLLELQPIGIVTVNGRIGGAFVHWGYRVGNGRLLPAVLISWLVWTFLGGAIIGFTQSRSQPQHVLMVLAWAVDGAALLRVLGVLATTRSAGRPGPGSLLPVAGVLVAMLIGSVALWWYPGTARARTAALVLAGAPPLVVGVGYGLLTVVMLIGGGRGGWK